MAAVVTEALPDPLLKAVCPVSILKSIAAAAIYGAKLRRGYSGIETFA